MGYLYGPRRSHDVWQQADRGRIQYQPGETYDGHFVSTLNPSARAAIQEMLVTACSRRHPDRFAVSGPGYFIAMLICGISGG
jgi:hypothetical protein